MFLRFPRFILLINHRSRCLTCYARVSWMIYRFCWFWTAFNTTETGLEKTWLQMSCQFMTDRLLVASYHHFPSRCLPFPSLRIIRYLFPQWKDCGLTELGATYTESNKWYSREGREKEAGTMIEWAFQSPYHYSLSTQFHDLYFWLLFKRGKFKLDSGLLLIQSRKSYLSPSRTWLLLTTWALTVRGIS